MQEDETILSFPPESCVHSDSQSQLMITKILLFIMIMMTITPQKAACRPQLTQVVPVPMQTGRQAVYRQSRWYKLKSEKLNYNKACKYLPDRAQYGLINHQCHLNTRVKRRTNSRSLSDCQSLQATAITDLTAVKECMTDPTASACTDTYGSRFLNSSTSE